MELHEGRRNNTMNNNNYNNNNNNNNKRKERCLTMHQPWASLLVHGIKRIEGRSWPSPLTGRLWIHAASKIPDRETVKTMEEFYREIYARDGITDLKFPQNYPVSKLIGCIEVVGCVRRKELASWKEVPEGVRLEALTDFCWLCEHPQRLSVPIQMGGWKGVYDLDSKINEALIGSLIRTESPLPLKFTLPNPEDPTSLRPDSLSPLVLVPEIEKSPKLCAIIDAASQAATQFSNKGQNNNASRAATHFSNKGRDTKSNGFDSRNNGNFTTPEDVGFVRNSQYNGNYHFEDRNQRHSSRPTATQYVRKEQNMGSKVNRFTPQINEAATQSSTTGESSKSNGVDSRDFGNYTRPKYNRFLRNNQYTANYRFDNRNQSYSFRPAATQYVKKEQNNGLHSRNQGDLYTSTSTQFVQRDQIDGTENKANCNDYRSTPLIFAAAFKGIRPLPHTG